MTDYELIEVDETPYLYVTRRARMEEGAAAEAMGSAFAEVWAFMERHGVEPTGGALAVYYDYSPDEIAFRAGFTIRAEDAGAAAGEVKADVTPGGKVMHFTHRGPYAGLQEAYAALMTHMEAEGLEPVAPTWEVYLNSPEEVHEEQLLTECYQALAG